MMLYAYGVVSNGRDVPPVAGIADSTIEILDVEGLAVAASWMTAKPEPAPQRLAEHHRVTLALGDVVPFRFGTVFRDEDELAGALRPRAEAMASKLLELAGCVELTVRLPVREPSRPAVVGGPGTAYLSAKKRVLALEDSARETSDRLRERLGDVVKDASGELSRLHDETYANVALLVQRERVAEVRLRLQELAPEQRISGPWAPSSFA